MTPRIHLATLVDTMQRLGDQPAIVAHRGVRRFRTSYGEMARGAAWFAAELIRRGIRPGERVVLWGENSAPWIECFFGCVMRGVLVVPLDATGSLAFAQRVVLETSPRLIVGDALLLLSLAEPTERITLVQMEDAVRRAAGVPDLADVVAEGLGPDTPLQILFTSGTTAEPKGIVHTHRNLLASLTPIEREIEKYRRYERFVHPLHFLHTLPLSHVFGQFMGLWVAPVLGAVVHYESRLQAGRLLRLLRRERISVLAAVPRVLGLLRSEVLAAHPGLLAQLEAARQLRIAKRWWRFRRVHRRLGYRFWAIVCGGATLPPLLEDFWTTLGVALIQGYGMTETSALVTLNHPFKPARGTLGAPLPGRELRISSEGELQVRGEMVATSIWKNGAQEQTTASDGWLATGDLTRRDDQGRLLYLGRSGQRLVTAAGLNVYLEDVEAALLAQPGVVAALALAIEGLHGPEPGAVLLATQPATAVEDANANLAPYQRIGRWWLWPGMDLPRTATGKVRRHVVESWVEDRLRDETACAMEESVNRAPLSEEQDLLLQLIAEAGGDTQSIRALPRGEADDSPLESLGIDSLARVQLQAALERATGRSVVDAEMAPARTLGELRRLAGNAASQVGTQPSSALGDEENRRASDESKTAPPQQIGLRAEPHPEAVSATPRQASGRKFLYLYWPWSAPAQLLRTLFLEGCVRPLVWLLAKPCIAGVGTLRDIQPNTPLLIVANHVSTYDVPLLLYALPAHLRRRVATAAAGEMLDGWRHARGNPLGPAIFWLLTVLFNVFPLPRGTAFRRAFEHAGEAMDQGYSVLVFPEGARSHGAPMQPFRPGIGLLAQAAGVQVLPVALEQWRSRTIFRPFAATIHIGEPLTINQGDEARAITDRLEHAVHRLLRASAPTASP